jgi:hypothetical protein
MNILNKQVHHKTFGNGIVIEQDNNHITVKFEERISQFPYPNAFEKFLTANDNTIQIEILNELKLKAENERKAAELARAIEAKKRAKKEAENRERISKKTGHAPKSIARTNRIAGKRMTFFVFQGGTFDREYKGGYIWAPKSNKSGYTIHHWERLLDVREGDILLHGNNGYVQAISIAKGPCYDSLQPTELTEKDLWENTGRRVDCDYIYIQRPIKTSNFNDDIIRLCNVKYAPFDKDGNGNMGYLFEINRELARIFIKASTENNPYLLAEEFITEILTENEND